MPQRVLAGVGVIGGEGGFYKKESSPPMSLAPPRQITKKGKNMALDLQNLRQEINEIGSIILCG